MEETHIEFVELPPKAPRGAAHDWEAITAELQARPGEWARVLEDVNSGLAQALAKRGCEVTTRRNNYDPRTNVDVYARWPR